MKLAVCLWRLAPGWWHGEAGNGKAAAGIPPPSAELWETLAVHLLSQLQWGLTLSPPSYPHDLG